MLCSIVVKLRDAIGFGRRRGGSHARANVYPGAGSAATIVGGEIIGGETSPSAVLIDDVPWKPGVEGLME